MDSVRCRTAERFPTRKLSFRFPGMSGTNTERYRTINHSIFAVWDSRVGCASSPLLHIALSRYRKGCSPPRRNLLLNSWPQNWMICFNRYGGDDLQIRCKVYFNMTEQEEALLFAQQTGISEQLYHSKILQRTYNPLYINSDSFPIGKTAAVCL